MYIDENFLEIANRTPNFIVRNRHLLFREGISCSSMGVTFAAAYLPAGSVFGVNPNVFPPRDDLFWLLAYLNSSLVTYFVRAVLLRTNMTTSGYAARIPLIPMAAQKRRRLDEIARSALAEPRLNYDDLVAQIDAIVFAAAEISLASERTVRDFCSNLLRAT